MTEQTGPDPLLIRPHLGGYVAARGSRFLASGLTEAEVVGKLAEALNHDFRKGPEASC